MEITVMSPIKLPRAPAGFLPNNYYLMASYLSSDPYDRGSIYYLETPAIEVIQRDAATNSLFTFYSN